LKVFLGGTVNGSKWRNIVKEQLVIDYFDPVVDIWNDAAYERELSERRNCDYLLYVLTPKMTGYYAVAEVTDDSYQRPDRTLYCYLPEDGEDKFIEDQISEFESLGIVISNNGAKWLKNLDEVINFLNTSSQADIKKKNHYDAFISYGKRQSLDFANKITNRLSELNYQVFYDVNDIPLIIDNEEFIYANILKSDNFIYVISPNSIRSEYNKKELDFAIKYKKRIIPVIHQDLGDDGNNLDDIVAKKKAITYQNDDEDLADLIGEIEKIIEQDKAYIQLHSKLLFMARQWEYSGRSQGDLLYGKTRREAIEWMNLESESMLPLKLHTDYISASKNLSPLMLPLLWLEKKTRFITRLKWFDKVTLTISLANPIAVADQLRHLYLNGDYNNVSLPMWFSFLIIQLTLTFVGIKNKDLGLFISMLLSVLVSSTVIGLVLYYR
jgi:TIR domain-containing protein